MCGIRSMNEPCRCHVIYGPGPNNYGRGWPEIDFEIPPELLERLIMKKVDEIQIKQYRKKPVVIHAKKITKEMTVTTLEGTMTGNPGDWLIIGIKGEEYFCKDDIFRETYEVVE